MSEYSFDVFLSVKDDAVFNEWVREYFLPLLTTYLKNDVLGACGRSMCGVYYYQKALGAGDAWRVELEKAIRTSRIALALCSPEYFRSEYCLTEFNSFHERLVNCKAKVLVPV